MRYREALREGERQLSAAGIDDARTDAWLLLEMVCRMERSAYFLHMEEEMPEERQREYEIALHKRAEHVPLQYIIGETEFMGLKFKVNSHVLIPRQDTETLVEEALRIVRPGMRILDLCTGSGCVIVSILHNAVDVEGCATDISKQALNVAKENARLNNVAVLFERSDLFDHVDGAFDLIVSNPPYIPTGDILDLMREVRDFEPPEALDGGEDGLCFYRRIAADCGAHLKPGGRLLLEIGYDQAEAVTELLAAAGFSGVRTIRDLARHDRVVSGTFGVE